MSAAVQADGDGLALRAISGSCAGNKITGSLSYGGDRGITGTLQTDVLSLGSVLQLALGPPRPVKAGQVWSSAPFAAPIKLPPTLVAVHIGAFGLAGAGIARDADFDLALAEGQLGLNHFSAKLGSGRLLGDLTLRRSGAIAAAEGHLSLDHYALDLPTAKASSRANSILRERARAPTRSLPGLPVPVRSPLPNFCFCAAIRAHSPASSAMSRRTGSASTRRRSIARSRMRSTSTRLRLRPRISMRASQRACCGLTGKGATPACRHQRRDAGYTGRARSKDAAVRSKQRSDAPCLATELERCAATSRR